MKNGGNGIGFAGTLAIVFIILKLVGVIKWSWFYILMPIWISPILLVLLIVLYCVLKPKENS